MRSLRGIATIAAAAALLLTPAWAAAAPQPGAYGENDYGGFRDVLPPGTNGRANVFDLGLFLGAGVRPSHNDDQLRMYGDLIHHAPGLSGEADLSRFFKDSTFGVRSSEVERRYSPREDVTIVRGPFGVPRIYGSTRQGALFGVGYVSAEDRLFFMDIFRNLGRAQLSSFAGGAPGNRAFDHSQWRIAPYTEADLQRQIDQDRGQYEDQAKVLRVDLASYVAGINAYIAEARLDPAKMPGEYAAIGRPQGPADWQGTDVVATASVIGGIFGVGGGGELDSALALRDAERRFGRGRGKRAWKDFRSAEDPEAPTTAHSWRCRRGRRGGRRTCGVFRYGAEPRRRARGSLALPDPGTVRKVDAVVEASGSGGPTAASQGARPRRSALGGLLGFPGAASNALLVSARESASGRPLAVFGPQTGYFAPQVLMEQEVHAPGFEARGVGFPGANLYVSIGHGVDYAWSATTSAQDLVDTFAVDLCEPDGSAPSLDSSHYLFRGACLPFEVLERRNEWSPTAADSTPAGSETLRSERSKLGIVVGRATIRGRPVAYTRLRATYFHETDSGLAFSMLNNPDEIRGPRDFQRAASLVAYAFNWFYIDDRDIAYFNSGFNPVRARGTDPNLPIRARRRFEWRDFDPEALGFRLTPSREHPQFVNQTWAADWNNKQARGYRASDSNWGYSSTYRVKPLIDRIKRGVRGRRKMSLVELVEAMADAATVDLRGDAVLGWALRAIGDSGEPRLRDALAKLAAWRRDGSHRIDRDGDSVYEHAEAIRIMDAWWPRWLRAQFEPVLGEPLFERVQGMVELSNDPNNHGEHLGSAWQGGWYGHARKDLRAVLGERVRGRYSRPYCGRGSLSRCRRALIDSLRTALEIDAGELYSGDPVCRAAGRDGDQWCWDALSFRPIGGITQPLVHWVNRPTYQQVVEVQGHRPR